LLSTRTAVLLPYETDKCVMIIKSDVGDAVYRHVGWSGLEMCSENSVGWR